MAGKKVLSIDIGVYTTRIVEMDYKKAKPNIYNVVSFDTPDGAVEDGYIRNREILSVAMKEALLKAGMRNNNVIFTMSSTKIANREVIIPLVPDNKIKGIVDSNAKEYFPVDIEQYVVSYTILERIKAEKNMRILVLAAPNQMIESYYEFAKMMSFEITALDYVGNSSLQILKNQITSAGTTMSVQFNEGNTLINISSGEVLRLQRTVPYGTATVIDAVLNSGEFGASNYIEAWEKLTSSTIINAKLDDGGIDDTALAYMQSNDDSYAQQLRVMKAKDDITTALSYLINNIIRVIDYYQAKFPESKIDRIKLCGPGSKISGITTLFRNEIFIEVDTLDNLYSVEFERAVMIDNTDKCLYMSAIGAAINPVDFIPKEHQVIAKKKNNDKTMLIAAAALAGVGALLIIVGVGKYTIKSAQKSSKEKEAKELEQYETLYNDYTAAQANYNSVKGLYVSTLNTNSIDKVFFAELEENFLTDGLVANSISSDGYTCTVNVSCANEDVALALISQLRTMTTVTDVNAWSWKTETLDSEEESADSPYSDPISSIKLDVVLTLDTSIPYEDIAAEIAAGKTFDEAIDSVYGIVSDDSADNSDDTEE